MFSIRMCVCVCMCRSMKLVVQSKIQCALLWRKSQLCYDMYVVVYDSNGYMIVVFRLHDMSTFEKMCRVNQHH